MVTSWLSWYRALKACASCYFSLCFLKNIKFFSPLLDYTPGGGACITDSNLSRDTLAFFFKFFHLFNETLLPSRYTHFLTYEAQTKGKWTRVYFQINRFSAIKRKGGELMVADPKVLYEGAKFFFFFFFLSTILSSLHTYTHTYG